MPELPEPPADAAPHHAASVIIGRFQPFHVGHAAALRRALEVAPLCVVVLGSAYQARTPKNPFTWLERAEMIRLGLPEADRARVRFLPMRDYYDEARWIGAVRRGVAALLAAEQVDTAEGVALVGSMQDPTHAYLSGFHGWTLLRFSHGSRADAAALRDAYFGGAARDLDATLAALVDHAPAATLGFLRAWAALPEFAALADEWRMLKADRDAWRAAPYPPVFVTVDAVVRCAGHVLLVRRGRAPGRGLWAVPGGFIEQRETVYQSAVRELVEETQLALLELTLRRCLRAVAVFDHPDRSTRGRTITHAHFFDLGDLDLPEVHGGDDAAAAEWVPIERLGELEDRFLDDHFHMLDHFFGLTGP
ncbi:NUDIX domain-containing protein [Piscinibacter koreensis]|uniref:NUDIX domain-containing protein n=1 Tax=Piscinibacter koreensis TaxID=2742824 RepID=A0A7Y6TYF8_9BURK|nr:NUDIX domain-containing protein [Schlegelella koreensis]NUZ08046.1 NUDIX domain-containing protein [Schlegelella koreensis]